ncbi:MAG: lipoyl(octanoyl) transferase LipB, partial [Planctomycetes bacterium]|nr:lipoyl(octanoyl) transferase LipB [Planctomycetota bacterium]
MVMEDMDCKNGKTLELKIARDIPFEEALHWQEEAVKELKASPEAREKLFLVEHRPVITLGRSGDGSCLRVDKAGLAARGIEYHETGRGGDVTYHGPGQWTVYPILRLEDFCRDLHRYMRMLEEMTIRFLAKYGLEGIRVEGKTGAWVRSRNGEGVPLKVAAVGVGVRNWISFHGTAVNIKPDLSAFRELMVPCGIPAGEGGV